MRSLRTWTRNRIVLSIVLVVVGLVLGTCGGGDDDGEQGSGTTTTEADDTTTTGVDSTTEPESTTTTVAAEGPAEWVAVARDIYERNLDLLANPDPARVTDLYAETCTCLGPHMDTVEFLASEGQHVEGQPASVLFVRHEQTDPTTALVDLTVKVQANPLQQVDADGTVVEEYPTEDAPSCVSYSLRPDGAGGAYRVYSQTSLTGCPEGV